MWLADSGLILYIKLKKKPRKVKKMQLPATLLIIKKRKKREKIKPARLAKVGAESSGRVFFFVELLLGSARAQKKLVSFYSSKARALSFDS